MCELGVGLKKFGISILLSAMALTSVVFDAGAADSSAPLPSPQEAASATDTDHARQLRIIETALLAGVTEQNRMDAAIELLSRADPDSRAILIKVLGSKENPVARQVICRSLIANKTNIARTDDFKKPLLAMLSDADAAIAGAAAQALLIFQYKDVAPELEKLLLAKETPKQTRLTIIYALKLWPTEKRALTKLVELLDDSDADVAKAADEALPYWVQTDQGRKAILRELKKKSPNEIIKDRILFQERELLRLNGERDQWRELFIKTLDKGYDKADDAQRGQVLFENLASGLVDVRLWALDKLIHRSAGVVYPEGFDPRLIALLSDSDKGVRFATATVLAKMSDLNSAEKLLAQFKVEEDAEVKLAIFGALGEACYFAFLGSKIELPPELRLDTLRYAGDYMAQTDPDSVSAGAEVIRKLLEPKGLGKLVIDKYLKLMLDRFTAAKGQTGAIRAQLLDEMARLCSQTNNKSMAAGLFLQAFRDSLAEKDDTALREAAVTGLINIDPAGALAEFRKRKLFNDTSGVIVKAIVELASQTGQVEDITWLAKRLNLNNGQGQQAWQAVNAILLRQDATVIVDWSGKLAAAGATVEKQKELLQIAEKKAEGQNDAVLLGTIRKRLRLVLLDEYIKAVNADAIANLFKTCVAEADLQSNDALAAKLTAYLNSQASNEAKQKVVAALQQIKPDTVQRPGWAVLLATWQGGTPNQKTDSPTPPAP